MKVNYYYLDHYEKSQRAMKKFAPDAEWVYTERGYAHTYPDHVRASWNKGDSLLVVEGDIVVAPHVLQSLEDCQAPWCTYAYPLGVGRTLFPLGYGCVKWSKDFQAAFPYERVTFHGRPENRKTCVPCQTVFGMGQKPCGHCRSRMCHLHQDAAFWHEMIKDGGNDVAPHVHGVVQHLHVQSTRKMAGFKDGILYWYM